MMHSLDLLIQFSNSIGYLGIIFLMTIESSFIPLPSEVVIPPAAFLAAQGQLNIFLVVISGIIGSILGALINYFLALTLGRKIIFNLAEFKIAKFFLINKSKIEYAENYFLSYSNLSTFLGRLVPAVRHLISIPAGFSRMKMSNFIFFTFLGSSLWVIILAILGYAFGANTELLSKYYSELKIFFIFIPIIIIIYFLIKKRANKKIQNHQIKK